MGQSTGGIIISRENRTLANPPERFVKPETIVEETGAAESDEVDNAEANELQIDDSYGLGCDPYNSTGQFLTDVLKKMRDA